MANSYNTDFMQKEENACYAILMYHDDYEKIQLPCYPDSISDSTGANWQTNTILGRTADLAVYTGTGSRKCSFSLKLHREMENSASIEDVLRFLRRTVYPKYKSSGITPPITKFVFGQHIISGYVGSVNFTWSPPIIKGIMQVCDVSIDVTSDPNDLYDTSTLGNSYNPFRSSKM